MISLRGLECLVAIVDEGSMTKAAAVLKMSQPALSYQIAGIERELGTAVIERLPRGTRPTLAGLVMADQARLALAATARGIASARRVAAGADGRIRIAGTEGMTGWLLAPVLRDWHDQYPAVEIDLQEHVFVDEMLDALLAGSADVALAQAPVKTDEHIELLGAEEIMVVAAPGHRFAAMDAVPLDELCREPLVHCGPGTRNMAGLDELAARLGVRLPRPLLRVSSAHAAAHLAATGIAVAIVPESAIVARPEVVVRSLDPPELREVIAVVAAPHDDLVARFVAHLKKRGLSSLPPPAAA